MAANQVTYTTAQIKAIIDKVATSLGVPTSLAEATAQQESGFNPYSVGDQGTSFGLYQLHQGGELGTLTEQQAFDPTTNATRALTEVAAVLHAEPNASLGQVAADAQRPANKAGYAASINAIIAGGGSSTSNTYSGPAGGAATGTTATAVQAGFFPTLPGGNYDPWNWGAQLGNDALGAAGSAASGAAGAAGGAVASGFATILEAIAAPFEKYLEDAALVLFGFVLFVVGVIMLAHAGKNGGSSGSSGGSSSGGRKSEGKDEGAGAGGDAADAAVLA